MPSKNVMFTTMGRRCFLCTPGIVHFGIFTLFLLFFVLPFTRYIAVCLKKLYRATDYKRMSTLVRREEVGRSEEFREKIFIVV